MEREFERGRRGRGEQKKRKGTRKETGDQGGGGVPFLPTFLFSFFFLSFLPSFLLLYFTLTVSFLSFSGELFSPAFPSFLPSFREREVKKKKESILHIESAHITHTHFCILYYTCMLFLVYAINKCIYIYIYNYMCVCVYADVHVVKHMA